MRVEFYGNSDDCIEIRVDGKDYEELYGMKDVVYENSNSKNLFDYRELRVTTIGGSQGVKVHLIYDGCWTAAAGFLEDGRSLPSGWQIRTENEHAYSAKLVIDSGSDLVLITDNKGKPVKGEANREDD